jgi:bacteriorhodopsin
MSSSLIVPDSIAKVSFYGTYAFLVTTGTITFIEALRTNVSAVRHILNLETCISIVAAYFYSKFVKSLEDEEKARASVNEGFQSEYTMEGEGDKNVRGTIVGGVSQNGNGAISPELYAQLNETRYTDWMITTPIMLLVLCLAFQYNNTLSGGLGKTGGVPVGVSFVLFAAILVMNWGMIGSGYLAETKKISRRDGLVFGFLFFFVLFAILYFGFLHGSKGNAYFQNMFLFLVFFILWSIYGVVYWLEDEALKNTSYNVLDLLSKCFVGIFFWAYFTGVFA